MKPEPIELAELLPSWTLALSGQRRAKETIRIYTSSVTMFLAWCDRGGHPAALTKPLVHGFIADLLESGAAGTSARVRQVSLRRFSAWLASEGEIDDDRLLGLPPPRIDVKVTDPLTDDELKRLFKACQGKDFLDRRDEAVLRLMAETGMRAGEVCALHTADVDLPRALVTITRGKGGRGRIVPISPQTAATLDRYLRLRRRHARADSAALWLGDRGMTYGYTALRRSLAGRANAAGIDRFHPHLLRHTAATRWLAAGGSEGGLMAVAGWQSREMLDRYTAATASDRAATEARGLNLGDL